MPVTGFPPVSHPDARVLILGSMPGVASLEAGQYYAQPRNLFWQFAGQFFGTGREAPYKARLDALTAHRVGLWDVLKSCDRPGSLDASIQRSSAVPNDFPRFLTRHPQLTHVFFNGKAAGDLYQRLVTRALAGRFPELHYVTLPSTSPANAGITLAEKLKAWRVVKRATRSQALP